MAAAAAAEPASTSAIFAVLLLVLVTAGAPAIAAASAASSSISSSSSYEDVRKLDKYGHSVQLKHAAMASQRHGRLVVAISWNHDNAKDPDGPFVMLCTPLPADVQQMPKAHDGTEPQRHTVLRFTGRGVQRIRVPLPASGQQQRPGTSGEFIGVSPLACVLTSAPAQAASTAGRNREPRVAVSCSGLASDAQFVHHQLREAAKEAWDTYDAELPGPAVLSELQGLCRQFWRHPTKRQWSWKQQQQQSGDDGDEEDSNGERRWSRPLGVTTLVVQLTPFQDAAQLYVVDPSGIVQPAAQIVGRQSEDDDASDESTSRRGSSLTVACIGKDGPAVQARLEKALRERVEASSSAQTRLTQDDLLEMIGDAVEGRPSGWRDRTSSSSENEPAAADRNERRTPLLYVEVLSTHGGVERKVVSTTTAA
jgi:hypothetical protein